jgi:hypothetical protein
MILFTVVNPNMVVVSRYDDILILFVGTFNQPQDIFCHQAFHFLIGKNDHLFRGNF